MLYLSSFYKRSFSVVNNVEDDLLVEVLLSATPKIDQFLAELLKCAGDCFMSHVAVDVGSQTRSTMRTGAFVALRGCDLGGTNLMASSDTLALHEELRQVLGTTVGNGPFPIFNAESRALLLAFLTTISGSLFSRRLFFSSFLAAGLFLSE